MFERFTSEARAAVTQAQVEARHLHHRWVGTEHLLLGLLARPESGCAVVLARHGMTHESAARTIVGLIADELDAEALRTFGIELDAVRDRVEEAFGPGALDAPRVRRCASPSPGTHIPFTPRAKKALELALREALALKSGTITEGHIALGLLREGEGLAARVLHDHGVDPGDLRRDLTAAPAS